MSFRRAGLTLSCCLLTWAIVAPALASGSFSGHFANRHFGVGMEEHIRKIFVDSRQAEGEYQRKIGAFHKAVGAARPGLLRFVKSARAQGLVVLPFQLGVPLVKVAELARKDDKLTFPATLRFAVDVGVATMTLDLTLARRPNAAHVPWALGALEPLLKRLARGDGDAAEVEVEVHDGKPVKPGDKGTRNAAMPEPLALAEVAAPEFGLYVGTTLDLDPADHAFFRAQLEAVRARVLPALKERFADPTWRSGLGGTPVPVEPALARYKDRPLAQAFHPYGPALSDGKPALLRSVNPHGQMQVIVLVAMSSYDWGVFWRHVQAVIGPLLAGG